jgi:DNA polymerase-3 subunit delta'
MAFRDIIGHRRVIALLSRSIVQGSLPPSLIFSGPEGVGKGLVAQAVAQALNCREVATELPGCGRCAACGRIARGVHPDVQTLAPGENGSIKIEQVRQAVGQTAYRPFEGRRRVTIIDDADSLMIAAQNALLKTLEEPPPGSVFILVTARHDALLPTVRSRCPEIRFGRLSSSDVATVLEQKHGYSTRDALAGAAAADGSVRRALEADEGEVAGARAAAEQVLRAAAGSRDARGRLDSVKELLKSGGGSASEREHLGVHLQALASLLRDLGVLASGADPRLLANVDLRPSLDALAGTFGSERAVRAFTAVDRAHTALDRNVSPKVVADWLALQL